MKYNTHNHINISHVDTDRMNVTVACIADTVLRPLSEFGTSRDLFGYAGALEIVAEWAKEFYTLYHAKMEDWDSFEETDENIYNAISWDEFATYWASDRLKIYLSESGSDPLKQFFGCSRFPKIIIVIKGSTVAAVYSTTPFQHSGIRSLEFT